MNYKDFKYSRFQKGVNLGMLVLFLVGVSLVWIVALTNLASLIGSAGASMEDLAPSLAGVVVGAGLVAISIVINMQMPDIRVNNGDFQLRSTFYKSQWLHWKDIQFVDELHLSSQRRRMFGIGIASIHPVYGLIGVTQMLGAKAFLLADNIQGFEELIEIIGMYRPDLTNLNG